MQAAAVGRPFRLRRLRSGQRSFLLPEPVCEAQASVPKLFYVLFVEGPAFFYGRAGFLHGLFNGGFRLTGLSLQKYLDKLGNAFALYLFSGFT
jgi:hypothetical protein